MRTPSNKDFPVHRIEAFSDAVFAFAVTLLVVSLEVPKSVHELFHAMQGFVAFGICFLFLIILWIDHAAYFKHFAVNDNTMLFLNMLLLFIVLLYVYPMKFLFSTILNQAIWGDQEGALQSMTDLQNLLRIYGLGFLSVSVTFMLMYLHSARCRTRLALDSVDWERLKGAIRRHLINVMVALCSLGVTLWADPRMTLYWSLCYMAIGPLQGINRALTGKFAKRARSFVTH